MITYTNHKQIEKKSTLAKRLSLVGLGFLFLGLLITLPNLFNPTTVNETTLLISYVALIVGTIASTIGLRYTEKWIVRPRNDQRIDKAVRGLDRRYQLINYYTSAEHVLLTPTGLYVVVVKDEFGLIRFDGKRWSQPSSLSRLWRDFRHGGLGNPTLEANAQIEKLQKWLKPNGQGVDVPVKSLILFSDSNVQLEIASGHEHIMPIKNLKSYLLKHAAPAISGEMYQALVDAIRPQAEAESVDETEAEADGERDGKSEKTVAAPSAPRPMKKKRRRS